MKVPAPLLLPILRSDTQGRILARLFSDPDAAFNLSELVAWSGTSMPTVQREVRRAEEAGIVTTTKVGPTRLVRANAQHPLYTPLAQIILATYGPPAIVAREFADLDGSDAVVLFGSWAARYRGQPGQAPRDIDVLIIGSPNRDRADDAAERVERALGLPVQVTIRSRSDWSDASDAFIREVKSRPIVTVLVSDVLADELLRESMTGDSR